MTVTVRDLQERFGVRFHILNRLIETKEIPIVGKRGHVRLIDAEEIPEIERILAQRGYMNQPIVQS